MSDYTKDNAVEQLLRIIRGVPSEPTDDAVSFRKQVTEEIKNRDKQYTKLLAHFTKVTTIRNYLKEFFKWSFYFAIIVCMFVLSDIAKNIFDLFIKNATIEQTIEAIPVFITAIVGFVSVIIAIPLAVTKYLFSTEEDKYITDIIQHTQNHDTLGRQWTLELKKNMEQGQRENGSDNSSERSG